MAAMVLGSDIIVHVNIYGLSIYNLIANFINFKTKLYTKIYSQAQWIVSFYQNICLFLYIYNNYSASINWTKSSNYIV